MIIGRRKRIRSLAVWSDRDGEREDDQVPGGRITDGLGIRERGGSAEEHGELRDGGGMLLQERSIRLSVVGRVSRVFGITE
ncbi:MAG: hypothetical protein CBC34_013875 [Hyphomicrobiaceae bacterium TMED74]|nr:hypothetical protein [Filomicrobium sp.]RPG39743.1 MAG: hypothetical protein CBC34_013875 [Hyphomicrobiaceae bacterium TMED74]